MADFATWLKASGLTQGQFAKMIGVSQTAVSAYVLGLRHPRPAVLRAIAAATGGAVMPNDFVPPDEPSLTPSPETGSGGPAGVVDSGAAAPSGEAV